MKISHYYPHSGGILGCHANVDFQHTNYLLNVTICKKLRCAHKLQTISNAFSHIASRFVKVALAIKFALNWLAGPQCAAGSSAPAGGQIHELVVVLAPPPRRDVTYAVRHCVPLDGVLISRNAPYAADCGRCLKGVMFAWAHSFACRLRISTLISLM